MSSTLLDIPDGIPTYAAIRDLLRADILSGKISAGSRLTTASLVERFGISQMPVREALQALEGEGLIAIQPHRGAGVLPLTAERVRNIYDLRGSIEGLLLRLALPNLTYAAMAELEQLHKRIREHVEKEQVDKQVVEEVFRLNQLFHDLIYRHADNEEAVKSYNRYANLLGSLRRTYGYNVERLRQMVDQHGNILQAIQDQDTERLEHVSRLHVEGAKQDLLNCMTEGVLGAGQGNHV